MRDILDAQSDSKQRNFGLDIVRCVAITMVVFAHGVTLTGIPFLGEMGSGVDLFFVLSGFLIGRICLESSAKPDFSLLRFWIARWWRTIPPYLAMLALLPLFAEAQPWYYLLFLQNYLGISDFAPSWSLCTEEHFYLALPLLVLFVDRVCSRRALKYILPALFVTPLLLRLATLKLTGSMPDAWWWMTHFHFEGLVAGVWLAYVKIHKPNLFTWLRRPALCSCLFIPILLLILPLWTDRSLAVNVWLYTFFAIGYTAWVRAAFEIKLWGARGHHPIRQFSAKVIRGIALCSYSIYLTHTTLMTWVRAHVSDMPRGFAKSLIILVFALAGGVVFYYLFERPAIRSRRWFENLSAPPVTRESLAGALQSTLSVP